MLHYMYIKLSPAVPCVENFDDLKRLDKPDRVPFMSEKPTFVTFCLHFGTPSPFRQILKQRSFFPDFCHFRVDIRLERMQNNFDTVISPWKRTYSPYAAGMHR